MPNYQSDAMTGRARYTRDDKGKVVDHGVAKAEPTTRAQPRKRKRYMSDAMTGEPRYIKDGDKVIDNQEQ